MAKSIFKSPIVWIVAAVAGLYAITRLSFGKKFNLVLNSVRPSGSILKPLIAIEFGIQNPTSQQIVLKSISGTVFVNDKALSNVSMFGDKIVLPNAETFITVVARPSAIGVFQSIKELLTTPTGNNVIRFTGTANVDGFTVPIDESKLV